MKLTHTIAASLLTLFATATATHAQGTAFTYQGRLNTNGTPTVGFYDMRFTVYDAASAGTVISGPLTFPAIGVTNGLFTTTLDFGAGVFSGAARWLEISVRTNGGIAFTALSPRQQITPAPYSLFSASAGAANTVAAASIGASQLNTSGAPSQGQVLAWNGNSLAWSNPSAANPGWSLTGNSGTAPPANFLGTTDNQPLQLHANGQRALRLEPNVNGAPNVIGGANVNWVAPGTIAATIAGGGVANLNGNALSNAVSSDFSTIGGGQQNIIQSGAGFSTIGGGHDNLIQSTDSTVCGGLGNTVGSAAQFAFVGGGDLNTNASYAGTIAGGLNNGIQANSDGSSIIGGANNYIQQNSVHSVIGGGIANSIQAAAEAVIAGGANNVIQSSASDSAISGGAGHLILSGAAFATVAGGYDNQVSGSYSFAGGKHARAVNSGCFVWSDASQGSTTTTANNQFMVRCAGGAILYTAAFPNTSTGVQLASGGGSWSSLSDRKVKENRTPVDSKTILDKVSELPIETWNYVTQDKRIRHIGPMAQDFYSAFSVGEDDRHITSVDEEGVALAAIQGLNLKLKARDAEVRDLKERVARLEKIVLQTAKPSSP